MSDLFAPYVNRAVRVWLGRMAGSLVLGAILGGAAAYYNVPRAITASVTSCASADATSPPWYDKASGRGAGEPSAAATEQSFGERLNKALFAARAGEAAAQQDLLVRETWRATPESGKYRGVGGEGSVGLASRATCFPGSYDARLYMVSRSITSETRWGTGF